MKKRSKLDLASGVQPDKSQADGLAIEPAREPSPERERPGSATHAVAAAPADRQPSSRVLMVAATVGGSAPMSLRVPMRAEHITKVFPGTTALDDVTFEIEHGEQVAVGRIEKTQPALYSADETADVGVDEATPVVNEVFKDAEDSEFTGFVDEVTISIPARKKG